MLVLQLQIMQKKRKEKAQKKSECTHHVGSVGGYNKMSIFST